MVALIATFAALGGAARDGGSCLYGTETCSTMGSYWKDGNERPTTDSARIAWMCWFGPDATNRVLCVYVDAQNGQVVGGEAGGYSPILLKYYPQSGAQPASPAPSGSVR